MKKRLLTGDRPTGPLHLGHYFGSLENRIKLQNKGYETFIIIADYQVLTDRFDTADLKENISNLIKDYISVGLDPKKSIFFIQSQIPQLAELTQIFSMLTPVSRVSRNPTVKEEVKSMKLGKRMSLGMFSYPVSQAADILLFRADVVPVGEDQLPHLELTREIAKKFNSVYGRVFPVPRPLLGSSPRLMGLDGQKMSKSRNNAIFLSDSAQGVRQKIMKAKTDSGKKVVYDRDEKFFISGLMDLYALVTDKTILQVEKKYTHSSYKKFKEDLADSIIRFLIPIQEKRRRLTSSAINKILSSGLEKASIEAEKTMAQVRKVMKMDYGRS